MSQQEDLMVSQLSVVQLTTHGSQDQRSVMKLNICKPLVTSFLRLPDQILSHRGEGALMSHTILSGKCSSGGEGEGTHHLPLSPNRLLTNSPFIFLLATRSTHYSVSLVLDPWLKCSPCCQEQWPVS